MTNEIIDKRRFFTFFGGYSSDRAMGYCQGGEGGERRRENNGQRFILAPQKRGTAMFPESSPETIFVR